MARLAHVLRPSTLMIRWLLVASAALVLIATAVMLGFLGRAGVRGMVDVGLLSLLTGTRWRPEGGSFGGLALISGTFATATGALLIGGVPAVGAAVWLTELAPRRVRAPYRRVLEVAAAIPSVVYGWLALEYLVPRMARLAHALLGDRATGGEGLASASVLLAVMIAPTVLLLSFAAMERVPGGLREASAALGASPWQTAMRVVVPHEWRSLLGAIFFGFARAAGETMAVQMVIGGARSLPHDVFSPTTTIASQIVMDVQNARPGTTSNDVLFSMSLVLLSVSVTVVVLTRLLGRGARAS